MQHYVEAYRLVKMLEERGLVSIEMPPLNFLMSDRLVGSRRAAAEAAMERYAEIMGLVNQITGSLKLISLAASAVILVDLLLR